MGANNFEYRINAKSPEEGFKILVDEAIENNGNDYYNGDINNTQLIKKEVVKKSELNSKIEHYYENLSKGQTVCLILKEPVLKKGKVRFENKPVVGKSNWVTKYSVETFMGEPIKSFNDKVSAVKFAKEYCEKNSTGKLLINLLKVREGGSIVGSVSFTENKNTTKGEYLFIGSAPC